MKNIKENLKKGINKLKNNIIFGYKKGYSLIELFITLGIIISIIVFSLQIIYPKILAYKGFMEASAIYLSDEKGYDTNPIKLSAKYEKYKSDIKEKLKDAFNKDIKIEIET